MKFTMNGMNEFENDEKKMCSSNKKNLITKF